jgi:hypothetical protein
MQAEQRAPFTSPVYTGPHVEAHNLRGRPGQEPVLVAPLWAVVLVIWMLLLWVLPDPRPLAAPEWAVQRVQSWVDLSEPTARAVVTFLFRAAGIAGLGMLLSLALSRLPIWRAGLFTLIGAPFAAVVVKWMNFGYFPITPLDRTVVVNVESDHKCRKRNVPETECARPAR